MSGTWGASYGPVPTTMASKSSVVQEALIRLLSSRYCRWREVKCQTEPSFVSFSTRVEYACTGDRSLEFRCLRLAYARTCAPIVCASMTHVYDHAARETVAAQESARTYMVWWIGDLS